MDRENSGRESASAALLEILHTPPPKEQARSARSRADVLEAAARLYAEKGAEAVSMDEVAVAAGVGKGTVYRRFGDKSGLAAALLDTQERALQKAILYGPPPLGPGAPAEDRLVAFVSAYLDYLLDNLTLQRTSETAAVCARYRNGAYRFWHRHTAMLLDATPDPEHAAHALLAALAAEHVAALLPELGEQRIRAGLIRLARSATQLRSP
ncbi:helix-turn-helix domain-containing protein [Streptomyces sp. NPDC086077]|uniref:TetR/AcrR family transcriptional regulator n=1 Tax=Streptomyces sp. NPDC086077 TaxID=3154862 RepID=UPI0034299737